MGRIIEYEKGNHKDEIDWKKEALLLYHYLITEEEKSSKEIHLLMEVFVKNIELENDTQKRKELYENLKFQLFDLKYRDSSFKRSLVYMLLISKNINELEKTYEEFFIKKKNYENILENIGFSENIQQELAKIEDEIKKAFKQAENRFDLINRTEMFRFVNESRLEEIRCLGYKYKTTYMIDDDRTGDDSRYFNSLRQIRKLDEDFEYEWKGEFRKFPFGPDRPNDRSILIPYVPE